jgi:hypothetical protein
MERQEIVSRLKGLREELEEDGVLQDITLTLFLSDVCDALGLSPQEREAVLGWDAIRAIDRWKLTQVWPTQEKETATAPVITELAAVSA